MAMDGSFNVFISKNLDMVDDMFRDMVDKFCEKKGIDLTENEMMLGFEHLLSQISKTEYKETLRESLDVEGDEEEDGDE